MLTQVSNVDISLSKVKYNKKGSTFSVEVLDYTFIGRYSKNTSISKILDDIYASLKMYQVPREKIRFIDINSNAISETTKLKDLLAELDEKRIELPKTRFLGNIEQQRAVVSTEQPIQDEKEAKKDFSVEITEIENRKEVVKKEMKKEEEFGEKREANKSKFSEIIADRAAHMASKSAPTDASPVNFFATPPPPRSPPAPPGSSSTLPPPPGAPPLAGQPKTEKSGPPMGLPPRPPGEAAPSVKVMPPPLKSSIMAELQHLMKKAEIPSAAPTPIRYDINMGLQYYAVIMEQNTYLFYVYFSHEELRIEDEEGKTVYKTTITITTTQETPPILNLRVQGDGFEVHPLSGNIEVKKDAVNPPIMIFSLLALKSKENKSKKEKKEGETRFLHVYVDFENKTVSHTVLSILVQPKFFKLKIGPINMSLSKTQAILISMLSILITVASAVYSITSMDLTSSSSGSGTLEGIIPGAGSLVFLVTFLATLLKKGVFPIKNKVSGLLDFNKSIMLK